MGARQGETQRPETIPCRALQVGRRTLLAPSTPSDSSDPCARDIFLKGFYEAEFFAAEFLQ
jgi:hypothetical protein